MLNICGRCKRWLIPFPCLEIQADAHKAYDYTSKGNLVAVIMNGTAIISAAALLNALEIAGKKIEDVRQQGRRSCGQDGLERIQARICNYQGSTLPCRGGCKESDINALYVERNP